jgi:predicted nucleotidyltransferase
MDLLPKERSALEAFGVWLRARFGDRLRRFALFGSRARDEGDEDSDVDVLVLVDGLTGAEAREIGHASGDVLTSHDVILSPFALSTARWSELVASERLIAREIERDAVAL